MNYKISVCIPAFNRPEFLPPLLDSIVSQNYNNFNIIICEDNSPKRKEIRDVASAYGKKYPGLIYFYENEVNLGYDGNIRRLFEKADGDYCLLMGNDDLMCPGALATVASALQRYDHVGVVMRSYAAFKDSPDNITHIVKYFDQERFFPASPDSVVTFFRRSVVLPGVTIHRKQAIKYSTDRFDGTLLYQIYLAANILADMNGLFLPEILALNRHGGVPDFGSSDKERGIFVPTQQTPESSVHFVRGMLEIAKYIETSRNIKVYQKILQDIGNYSYSILHQQARQPLPVFLHYSYAIAKLGFWKNKMFYLYFILLLVFGPEQSDNFIRLIKAKWGYTPVLGKLYRGHTG